MRIIGTVYGVLLNDAATVARWSPAFHEAPYKAPPVAPILYIKPRNTFADDGAVVAVPSDPGVVRIEATIGAVIGRTATRIRAADARSFVKGFVVVSDISLPLASIHRPAIRQRCRDGFCPIGAMTVSDGFDPDAASVAITIDGVEVHRRTLAPLVRPLPKLLEDVTAFMTLDEDDILLLGAPDDMPLARPGNRVAIAVAGLRTLTHGLVLEAA